MKEFIHLAERFCKTDLDMIPVAAFFNVDWITVHSMFFQNKRLIRIISKWRMNAVLEMMKLGFLSSPVWPVTK
jgi:hypothetical protein